MARRFGTTLMAAVLLLGGLLLVPGTATASVSSTPAATPQLGTSGTDGSVESVRQIVQCGGTMYAVGEFSHVKNPKSNTLIARNNAFAFSATDPHRVTAWDPNVNGRVDTVACAPDGDILVGGSFSSAGGATVRNLAKVDEVTGANQSSFALQPAGRVAHVEVVTDEAGITHVLVGRYAAPYLRSVNPVTGANDKYGVPAISGTYQYDGVVAQTPRIYNMTVSPDGTAVLMTGIFTDVGGQHHEQVFRLNLTQGAATVSRWSPTELYEHCFRRQPFYAQDAAWAPDMDQIYVATTGYRLHEESLLPSAARPQKRSGPCDAAIAYPAEPQEEFDGHTWINYTGCDSLYSVAADAETVFVGGHQRWISNGEACDKLGTGGFVQAGLGHIHAGDGAYQPGANRGRGLGAADLLRTPAGLWIASDNQANTSTCGGVSGRMGICFLPN